MKGIISWCSGCVSALCVTDKWRFTTGRGRGRGRAPRMLAAKSDEAARAFQQKQSLSALHGLPLAERAERAVLNYGKQGHRYGFGEVQQK